MWLYICFGKVILGVVWKMDGSVEMGVGRLGKIFRNFGERIKVWIKVVVMSMKSLM